MRTNCNESMVEARDTAVGASIVGELSGRETGIETSHNRLAHTYIN